MRDTTGTRGAEVRAVRATEPRRKLRIGIATISERSSCNAGLAIAALLARLGHEVVFVGDESEEARSHVQQNGFPYLGLGADLNRHGPTLGALAFLERQRRWLTELIAEGDQLLAKLQLDLLFFNVHVATPAAFVAARTGVPSIVFSSNYASRLDWRWPPVFSGSRPLENSRLGKVKNLSAWAGAWYTKRASPLFRWRRLPENLLLRIFEFAARHRAVKHGWRYCYGEWGPRPALPDIVVGHKALDWPALHGDRRFYLSGSHAMQRREFDASWAEGLDERPLAYCFVSTTYGHNIVSGEGSDRLTRMGAHLKNFLRTTIEAFGARPDWQLVVSCGPFCEALRLASLPPNVKVLPRVPQLEVLARASVAIVQGGPATLRECVYFGVPVLMFTIGSDQPGNAARVEFHKVGRAFEHRNLRGTELMTMVDELRANREIIESVRSLSEKCRADAALEERAFVDFVARHASLSL